VISTLMDGSILIGVERSLAAVLRYSEDSIVLYKWFGRWSSDVFEVSVEEIRAAIGTDNRSDG
jgi:hypothetical protein